MELCASTSDSPTIRRNASVSEMRDSLLLFKYIWSSINSSEIQIIVRFHAISIDNEEQ